MLTLFANISEPIQNLLGHPVSSRKAKFKVCKDLRFSLKIFKTCWDTRFSKRNTYLFFCEEAWKKFPNLKMERKQTSLWHKNVSILSKNQLQTLKSAASKYQVSNVTHCCLKLELNLYHWLMANVAEFPDGLLAEDYLNLRFARLLLSKGLPHRRRSFSHFRPEK